MIAARLGHHRRYRYQDSRPDRGVRKDPGGSSGVKSIEPRGNQRLSVLICGVPQSRRGWLEEFRHVSSPFAPSLFSASVIVTMLEEVRETMQFFLSPDALALHVEGPSLED